MATPERHPYSSNWRTGKLRQDGSVAMVLPLSAMSGSSWNAVRMRWRDSYDDIMVVTVAGPGTYDSSFSADTGMAECLLVAKRAPGDHHSASLNSPTRGIFVMLSQQVQAAAAAELLAAEIIRLRETGQIRRLEDPGGLTSLLLGGDSYGVVIDAPLPKSGPWPLAGIADGDLAKAAYHLEQGALLQLGQPGAPLLNLPITKLGKIAERGPVHRDITEQTRRRNATGSFRTGQTCGQPCAHVPHALGPRRKARTETGRHVRL